jgi:hypothetical protein
MERKRYAAAISVAVVTMTSFLPLQLKAVRLKSGR